MLEARAEAPFAAAHEDAAPRLVTWRSLAPSYGLAALATLLMGLFAVSWGTVHIPPLAVAEILLGRLPLVPAGDHPATWSAIVWDIRVPRVVLAGLVGATLAYSGAAYQGVFRNPLAEPYLIGVAAGASVGATLVIISPLAVTAGVLSPLPPAAFAGALVAVGIAWMLARAGRGVSTVSLILSGVAVSSLGTSVVTYLMLTYTDRTLSILNWVLGGFNTATWTRTQILLPYAAACGALLLPYARTLNVLQLDEDEARRLGVNVERVKLVVLGLASLATAAAVSVSGLIGFVGLVVPHTVRMVWGPDHRRLLPLSAFLGASFLIAADTIARSADAGREVPIGVITALVGAPFFLFLLRRQQRARVMP
ncbi:MAG TPA: iron ABC transporter permease [Dehalococcoidia bacterium]|nr:iron ABC transporter permease [Dehalococcoidia bacterium]